MSSHSRSATLRLLPMLIVSLLFFCVPRCLADEITVLEAGIQDLQSDHVEVRRQAAVRLGRLADRANDDEPKVRFYAAYALGERKDLRAGEALLQIA